MAVLVTGASAGFGKAVCEALVRAGYRVIGAARRAERLAQMRQDLGGDFYPLPLDLGDRVSVQTALSSLPPDCAEIDCLINNGGLALGLDAAHQADFADWETMIRTNILGLSFITHQVLPQMVARGSGYIINIGSIAGTYPYPGGNVYGASKAFVRQFSLNLRADLQGTGIRVSNIEPGLCGGTEFSAVRFKGDSERAAALYRQVDFITPQDIADTVLWLYRLPKHVNVNSIEMMPTAQAFGALPVTRDAG
ncbi:SDR family oxidoreductase [Neisseria leonii]|uniref:SDR family oxidoreductase n=1 Tax=Neisseria leonii TaxID=2995413 RepID=A0A9X4E4U5_9NEIS|nr:SDR family oxidoreductase [Neisseria sp. 51.81]MDD9327407.1 SDR family oxidoreductase [Neisseria sp. 51.81]